MILKLTGIRLAISLLQRKYDDCSRHYNDAEHGDSCPFFQIRFLAVLRATVLISTRGPHVS
jgi:hypothetical protein